MVVSKLDKLDRNAMDVRVHCLVLGGVDLTSSVCRLLLRSRKDLLVERTRAGIERAKEQGKRLGRPPSLTPEQKPEVLQLIKDGETIMRVQASKVCLETSA